MREVRCTVCDRLVPLGVEQAVQRTHTNACEACGRPLRQHDLLEKMITGPDELRRANG